MNEQWKEVPYELAGVMQGTSEYILEKLRESYPEPHYDVTIGREIEPSWFEFLVKERKQT